MLKQILFSVAVPTVLIGGLVSCSKDGHAPAADSSGRPSSLARAPRIVRHEGLVDLPAWDKAADKNLTLNDSLDLSVSHPRGVEITARCGDGAKEIVHHSWFENPETVSIYQTLPEALLTRDLAKAPEACRFEVTLSDDYGRRHGYLLSAVIHEDDRGQVRLSNSRSQAPSRLDSEKLTGIKLRFDGGRGRMQARLVCGDISFPALTFNQVIDLGDFDLSAFKKIDSGSAVVTTSNPVQKCRFLIEEPVEQGRAPSSSQRVAISNEVLVQFSHGGWWIEPIEVAPHIGRLKKDERVVVSDVLIHNLENETHWLRSRKSAYKAKVRMYLANPLQASDDERDWLGIEWQHPSIRGVIGSFKVFEVLPGEALHLRVVFKPEFKIACLYSALSISATEPIQMEDLGKDKEVRATIALPATKPGIAVVTPDTWPKLTQATEIVPKAKDSSEWLKDSKCSLPDQDYPSFDLFE